ncbi:MAG TPA: LytS/YhcK type 5TM receptor domain-containing protein, partial [Candidatus Cryosericum sp.]|nr:LytS/YhcK type 5TM receptor domain-containing protein [Candidatus Cryosericum sp.]
MSEPFVHLVANAAILLALVYVFDLLRATRRLPHNWMRQGVTGLVIGFLGLVIMHLPWSFGPGIIFDTRTVLLAISGLFFGAVPTIVAMAMTAAYRLYLGG